VIEDCGWNCVRRVTDGELVNSSDGAVTVLLTASQFGVAVIELL
jgi:hypothetical protein